jgi:hypothetical protein
MKQEKLYAFTSALPLHIAALLIAVPRLYCMLTRQFAGVRTLRRAFMIVIGIWGLSLNVVQAQNAAEDTTCDKGCMLTIANTYLDALISHDPTGVPFSPQLFSTENRKAIKPGEGMWKTVGPMLNYRQTLVDPIAGQIVIFAGGVEVGGASALYMIRLHVKNRMIIENEMVSVRKGDHAVFKPENLTQPDPIFEEVLPDDERSSRKELVAIAQGYFDAITFHDASKAPFGPDCLRIENGGRTTDAFAFGKPLRSASIEITMPYVVTNTRYVFADEARGLVLGVGLLRSTNSQQIVWIYDLFKIKSGHLRSIFALVRVPDPSEPPIGN